MKEKRGVKKSNEGDSAMEDSKARVEAKARVAESGAPREAGPAGGGADAGATPGEESGPEKKQRSRRVRDDLAMVRKLIDRLSESLTAEGNVKGTLGDLMKLMQLEKEMAPQKERRQITVKWVAPWED
jgi:hypothetical protein